MDITMSMIADRLNGLDGVRRYGFWGNNGLSLPRLYDGEIVATQNSLYVSKAAYLPEIPSIPKDSLLICAGITGNPQYHINKFPFIEVPNITVTTLFQKVQDLYLQFQQWDMRAQQILHENVNVEALLKEALPVLENPIFVADTDMNYLAQAALPDQLSFKGQPLQIETGSYGLPLPVTNAQDVHTRIRERGYDIDPRLCEDYGNTVYSIDLFFGSIHIGQLSVLRAVRDFYPSDAQLLKLLAKQVETAFQKQSTIMKSRQATLKNMLDAMLRGMPINENRLYSALPVADMPPQPRERFLAVYTEDVSGVFSQNYLCKLFEQRLPGTFTLGYMDGLVCLIDQCTSPYPAERLINEFVDLSAELSISIGSSRWFADISQFLSAVAQATTAYRYAGPGQARVCSFEESALPYMLRRISGEFTAVELAPEGFREFLAFCQEKKYDYLHLLQVYLDHFCNASLSAQKLYMNRSTFLKRMSHIRDFLGDAFDDPEKLLRLTLCMKLLEYNQESLTTQDKS